MAKSRQAQAGDEEAMQALTDRFAAMGQSELVAFAAAAQVDKDKVKAAKDETNRKQAERQKAWDEAHPEEAAAKREKQRVRSAASAAIFKQRCEDAGVVRPSKEEVDEYVEVYGSEL